ncbi:MAG TPA: hypothetical protein VFH17_08120 [Coriobacteriia bacterium]|nr:hypothetical protein [Coriobacteriia bacterium]
MRARRLLEVERFEVRGASVVARVRVAPDVPVRTSGLPGIAQAACDELPGLARHRCDCGSPRGIVAELSDTELPHLVEHVALELLALAGFPRTISGETTWDFARDGRGVFHVTIRSHDAAAARSALGEATRIVDALAARALARRPFDPPAYTVVSSPAHSERLRVE